MRLLNFFSYFSMWYIFSGQEEIGYIVAGLFASIFATAKFFNRDSLNINISMFIKYFIWLINETCSSSLKTIMIILSGKIMPKFHYIKIDEVSDIGHTIFDNSITLTPGTICISDSNNSVVIHALHEDFLKDIVSGKLEQKMRDTVLE